MKIQIIYQKKVKCINLNYHTKNQQKNKAFNLTDVAKAMDFALTIHDDLYISTCSEEIHDWCIANKHPILKKKCWEFS